jgi:hypothetical protein
MNLNLGLDPAEAARVRAVLSRFPVTADPYLRQAMELSLTELQYRADQQMMSGFTQNSPGGLASTLQTVVHGPFQGEMGTNSPYAWRRDRGFSGMTDSLGRYYPSDPGILYAEKALSGAKSAIKSIYRSALGQMLASI